MQKIYRNNHFEWAAITRQSRYFIPAPDMICVDLGYKSVASENPLPRVLFFKCAGSHSDSTKRRTPGFKSSGFGKFQSG